MKNCDRIYTDSNCNIIIDDEFNDKYVNIYIIKHIAANGIVTNKIILKEKDTDKIVCSFNKDGHYNICRIDVPLSQASYYYYKDGDFYKNINKVSIKEIISVNPEVSKLNFQYDDYFCKCHLWNCYIKTCQEIFDKRASFRCDSSNIDNTLIYKRDLLNSVLNTIDYLVYFEQYAEAQRLLERISGCNGICDTIINNQSCGCM